MNCIYAPWRGAPHVLPAVVNMTMPIAGASSTRASPVQTSLHHGNAPWRVCRRIKDIVLFRKVPNMNSLARRRWPPHILAFRAMPACSRTRRLLSPRPSAATSSAPSRSWPRTRARSWTARSGDCRTSQRRCAPRAGVDDPFTTILL